MTEIRGCFDSVTNAWIEGWAYRVNDDIAAVVEVIIDGKTVGEVFADSFRDDLRTASIREGYAAFAFAVPPAIFDGQPHIVQVKAYGAELLGSPKQFCRTIGELKVFNERANWAKRSLHLHSSFNDHNFIETVRQAGKLAIFSTFHLVTGADPRAFRLPAEPDGRGLARAEW